MFYITAHTITQNQFANAFNDIQSRNTDVFTFGYQSSSPFRLGATTQAINNSPIVLLPNNLRTKNITSLEKSGDLHEIIIADGLRYVNRYSIKISYQLHLLDIYLLMKTHHLYF